MALQDLLRDQPAEVRAAYEAVDWAVTALGPESGWSPALTQAVSTCLASRFPMLLCWGPELVMLYNAGYVAMIGSKHPAALGAPAKQAFPESWDVIGPLFDRVLAGGGATYSEDFELVLERSGFLEQTYFTFSYSPVLEQDGRPGGVLDVTTETTGVVRSRRRLELLRRLGEELSPLGDEASVIEAALSILRTGRDDFHHVVLVGSPVGGTGLRVEGHTVRVAVPLGESSRSPLDLLVQVHEQLPVDADLLDVLSVVARVVGGALVVARALAEETARAAVQTEHAARMGALAMTLQELGGATSEGAVLDVLSRSGADVLHADGTVVVLADEGAPDLRARFTTFFGDRTVAELSTADRDLPMGRAAVDGSSWFLSDRAAATAAFPASTGPIAATGAEAVASVPLRAGSRLLGSLSLVWTTPRAFPVEERDVVDALAAATAQTLDRIAARDAERETAQRVGEIAETLQRSLLTQAPDVVGLALGTRYRPAGDHARVGGDWYDVFEGPDGTTRLVVGDVTGHDRDAAALMGQLRNLLRGVAYAHPGSPSQVLGDLEEAMAGLGLGTLATVVHAEVRWQPAGGALLTWCNAGHPPPVLLRDDGTVSVLADEAPDLLLGLELGWPRRDHAVSLYPGDTVLLHTDGLVERRGESLEVGTERLRLAVQECGQLPLEVWCDQLLDRLDGEVSEDDVVVLAVRVLPPAGDAALVVPRHAASVAEVRRYTRTSCAGLPACLVDTAVLLVSEVTTNAVVHGGGRITVRVVRGDTGVCVEVSDESDELPVEQPIDLDAEGGRGIELVERLASAWGVRQEPVGKTVWFEVE